ncbi:MAG: YDG domain-containing protein [Limisphaerales bacterium]
MQLAKARGARVWSTPWSPPAVWKNTNSLNGGSYVGIGGGYTNQLYARQLAGYVATMKNTYSINIYAISIQNEPDVSTTYASCLWTAQQFHDFTTNVYNALVASNVVSTRIMLPEDEHWQTTYYTTAMNDTNVAVDVSIIADHNYDGPNFQTGSTTPPAALTNYGKALWETEVSTGDAFDGSITNAVYWAQRIHLFLTVAQANAWHYWWLISGNSDNEGLTDTSGNPAKRMYALGQFSRFVRPNYYRIGASNTGHALISAYNDTNYGNFAIVAINTNTSSINQTFNLTNFSATSVTPWMTTSNLSLASQTPVVVSGSSFSYTLPALSVVTFVGQNASNPGLVTTTVGLTASSNPSTYGNPVTFTATVQTNGVAVGGISGETITFRDGGTQLGTGTLNGSGQAAYSTGAAQLSATTHSITAGYGGDTVYAGSTNSPALSQTVSQATLTAGLTGTVSKTYDGTTAATLTAGNYTPLSGVVSGDAVTLNNPTSGAYDTRNQGSGKTVTVTGLAISGASATNYTLSSTSAAAAVGTINQTNITVTAAANSKTYDGTTGAAATPTITPGAVQSGDTASFVETYDTKNQGTSKTLTPSGSVADGNSGNNYNYSFVPSANGTITAATLAYAANKTNMIYGSAVPGLSGSVGGFVGTDTQANATTGMLAFMTPATSSSSVGSYAINGSGLTANNGNYTFVQAAGNVTALGILPLVTPAFASPGISAGAGGWQLSFSAQAGQSYKVLATGDLTLPVSQWTILTNDMFGATGAATFTDGSATNLPQRFYQIVSP